MDVHAEVEAPMNDEELKLSRELAYLVEKMLYGICDNSENEDDKQQKLEKFFNFLGGDMNLKEKYQKMLEVGVKKRLDEVGAEDQAEQFGSDWEENPLSDLLV